MADVLILKDSVSILVSRNALGSEEALNEAADILFFKVIQIGRVTNGGWSLTIPGPRGVQWSKELESLYLRNLILMTQPTKEIDE